jgi:hypothetical protein
MHRLPLLVATSLVALSLSAASSGAPEVRGTYRLIAIGATALAQWTKPTECFEVPASSVLVFSDSTWTRVDSARTSAACPWDPERSLVRAAGRFWLAADTIFLYHVDRARGTGGLALKGQVRGDTIILWMTDYDPGHFVYARR